MSTNIGDLTKNISLDAVPYSCSSSRLPMALQSANRLVQVASSFGNQSIVGTGSQLSFNIPTGPGTGYCKNQSSYLRFKIILNDTTNTTWNFGGPESDGSAVIQNIRANVGGTQIENINQYSIYHQAMLGHFCNKGYVENTSNILSATLQDGTGTTTGVGSCLTNVISGGIGAPALNTNTSYSVCIPLALNMLNGTKSLPLFLMGSSPFQIIIDLAPLNLAMQTASTTYTNLIITDPILVYEEVKISPVIEMSIIETMKAEGKHYELPLITVTGYNTTVTTNQSLAFFQSLNLRSMLGVLYGSQLLTDQTVSASKYIKKYYNDSVAPTHRLVLDGQQHNNYTVQYDSTLFSELLKVGTTLYNSNISTRYNSAGRTGAGGGGYVISSYSNRNMMCGFSTKMYNENNLIGRGRQVQNMNLYIDSTNNTASNFFIYVVHEAVMLIDGYHNVSLLR